MIYNNIIELNTDETFDTMACDDIIHGLLSNGYVLHITPCKYHNGQYTMILEIGGIDESFIPQPTERVNNE